MAQPALFRSIKRITRRVYIVSQIVRAYLGPRKQVGQITVLGPELFIKQTLQAIELLQAKAPAAHRLLYEYVSIIVSATPSGAFTRQLSRTPTTMVNVSSQVSHQPTAEYAAMLAHEAFHCELYARAHQGPPNSMGVDTTARQAQEEQQCLNYQCDVMRQLGVQEERVLQYENTINTRWWEVPYEERDW